MDLGMTFPSPLGIRADLMNAGTAAAALIGGTTVAAYLNAKFHFTKDVRAVLTVKKGEREYAKAGKCIDHPHATAH